MPTGQKRDDGNGGGDSSNMSTYKLPDGSVTDSAKACHAHWCSVWEPIIAIMDPGLKVVSYGETGITFGDYYGSTFSLPLWAAMEMSRNLRKRGIR